MQPNQNLPSVLVTLATYNERENLPDLLEAIWEQLPSADILVIDDNSPDGTGTWVDQQAKDDPRLHCLHREKKLGLGTATIAGLNWAVERGYDFAINMDADFSHHPRYLPDVLAATMPATQSAADVVIGSRYVAGGGVEGWPLSRRMMSRTINWYARCCLGISARDCSGAFRCYRIAFLRNSHYQPLVSRGYSYVEEILWRLERDGATIREVPIVFTDRERGKSKINYREAIAAVAIIFRLGVQHWTSRSG